MAYTNGKAFLLNDKSYTGIYSKGPDNNYYTGENYIFGISKFLTPIIIENNGHRIKSIIYDFLESKFTKREINYAINYYPKITDKDLKKGFIIRYFVQQWNDLKSQIIEIDKKQFDKVDKGFYQVIKLKWLIIGNTDIIRRNNLEEVRNIAKTMPMISFRLANLMELYNSGYIDII